MQNIFAVWMRSQVSEIAWLNCREPLELKDIGWKFSRGRPVGNDFPEDVIYDLSPQYGGVYLADCLPNTSNCYVVSEKLRGVLETSTASFEFHRIRIRNHKGRIEKAPYYMVNLLDVVDCMDRDKSDYDVCAFNANEALNIRRLVLDHSKIPPDAQIFRLASERRRFIVRKDLGVDIFRTHNCEGVRFQRIEDYGEEFRPVE